MSDRTLDARALDCPLPVVEARRALESMQPGQTLEVLTTVPDSDLDFEAMCRIDGHKLLQREHGEGVYRFVLRRSGRDRTDST
jgi:tRNA 2-thiouridine synthesizing protein A